TAGAGASLSRAGPRSVFGADAMVVAVCRVRRVTRSMVDDPREPADFFLRFCECLNKAGAPPWAPITLTLSLQPSAIQLAISHQPSAIVRLQVRMPSLYDRFNLVSDFMLAGDQERAIGELVDGLERGDTHQVLLGVTGSGKTFTMAKTIARVNRPTLVMVHNKTLAAQLYQEFRRFFPENA